MRAASSRVVLALRPRVGSDAFARRPPWKARLQPRALEGACGRHGAGRVGSRRECSIPRGQTHQGARESLRDDDTSGTCGAPLRGKDGHQARDDVFFARHTCEHGLCATCPIGSDLSALKRIRSTNVLPAGFRGRRVLSDLLAHYWQLRGGSSGGKGACARGGDPIGFESCSLQMHVLCEDTRGVEGHPDVPPARDCV